MSILLNNIIEFLLKGRIDKMVNKMKNDPGLLKARNDVNVSLKNLNDSIAKFERDKKKYNL
jgi:hypothetical protein